MSEVEIKQWGNSFGVIIPIEKLRELGLREGDKVDISIVAKKRIDGFGIAKGALPLEQESEEHTEFW